MTRVRTVRWRPYVQYRLRGVRVNTTQHARLALCELEAPLRVDDDAWLLSERGEDRRLALDPHVFPMDELRRNARIELLTRRSLRLTAKQERIASVIEANPASLVTVRVDGRERELTNHHEGTDLSVGLLRLLLRLLRLLPTPEVVLRVAREGHPRGGAGSGRSPRFIYLSKYSH